MMVGDGGHRRSMLPYVIMSDKVAESESESSVAIAMCPNACGEGGNKSNFNARRNGKVS